MISGVLLFPFFYLIKTRHEGMEGYSSYEPPRGRMERL